MTAIVLYIANQCLGYFSTSLKQYIYYIYIYIYIYILYIYIYIYKYICILKTFSDIPFLVDISHGAISTTISTSGSSNAGKSYTLTCTITTSTTPTVTWSKGGSNLATDADLGITVGGVSGGSGSYTSVLTLNPLKVAHGGVYTCSADAGADSESDDETVNVQSKFEIVYCLTYTNFLILVPC